MSNRDWPTIIAALRAKADSTDAPSEAEVLRAKANELEAKYGPFRYEPPTYVPNENWHSTFPQTWEEWLLSVKYRVRPFDREAWLDSIVDDGYLYDE